MAIVKVKPGDDLKAVNDRLVDGDIMDFDPPGAHMDQSFLIEVPNITVRGNGSSMGMTLVPSVNDGTTNKVYAAFDEQGGTQAEADAAIADALAADVDYVVLPDGSHFPIEVQHWAQIGKGIITVKAGTYNTTVDGLEFFNAKIGSSYNGAGIRGQGIGLTVTNCYFHDNQNGVLTSEQYDDKGRPIGWVSISNCRGHDNGWDGYQHDFYLGPCARFIGQACPDVRNCRFGHHFKFNCGGGVAIAYGNSMMDDDLTDLNAPSSHCAVDGTSGHVFVVNNQSRKVMTTHDNCSVEKANYHDNDRIFSDIGCNYLAVGNYCESTVTKGKGAFFKLVQEDRMKDWETDPRVPPPMMGHIARNCLRYLDTGNEYNFGTEPFGELPAGVTECDNDVIPTTEPFEYCPLPMDGAPVLSHTSMIAWITFLRGQLEGDSEAQDACDRTLDGLAHIEAYDPLEAAGGPPPEIIDPDPPIDPLPVEPDPIHFEMTFTVTLADGTTYTGYVAQEIEADGEIESEHTRAS